MCSSPPPLLVFVIDHSFWTLLYSPGINRISLRLQSRPSAPTLPSFAPTLPDNRPIPPVPHRSSSNITSSISPSAPLPAAQPSLNNNPDHQIFDEHGSPLPEYYGPLMETFFTTLGPHFPSVSKRRMEERIETRTMSAFFLNCACSSQVPCSTGANV